MLEDIVNNIKNEIIGTAEIIILNDKFEEIYRSTGFPMEELARHKELIINKLKDIAYGYVIPDKSIGFGVWKLQDFYIGLFTYGKVGSLLFFEQIKNKYEPTIRELLYGKVSLESTLEHEKEPLPAQEILPSIESKQVIKLSSGELVSDAKITPHAESSLHTEIPDKVLPSIEHVGASVGKSDEKLTPPAESSLSPEILTKALPLAEPVSAETSEKPKVTITPPAESSLTPEILAKALPSASISSDTKVGSPPQGIKTSEITTSAESPTTLEITPKAHPLSEELEVLEPKIILETMNSLKEENDELKFRLGEKEKEIESLQHSLEMTRKQIDELKEENARKSSMIIELEAKLKNITGKPEAGKTDEERFNELNSRLNDLCVQLGKREKELEQAHQEIATLKDEINRLKSSFDMEKVNELSTKVAELNKRKQYLEQFISKLEKLLRTDDTYKIVFFLRDYGPTTFEKLKTMLGEHTISLKSRIALLQKHGIINVQGDVISLDI
ncbi:MAG: hypothetical protein QXL15_05160 [Candidatus Korarchaeota archaeon]